MGLVREDIVSDVEALTQWVCRKVSNHNPMKKREKATVNDRQKLGLAREPRVQQVSPDKIVYTLNDGRVFEFTVTEVTPSERSVERVGAKLDD